MLELTRWNLDGIQSSLKYFPEHVMIKAMLGNYPYLVVSDSRAVQYILSTHYTHNFRQN